MGEVVQLFKKIGKDEAKATIIANLRDMHHCKWVNYCCAVHGIDDIEFSHKILNSLIDERVVDVHLVSIPNGRLTMYRYNSFNDL